MRKQTIQTAVFGGFLALVVLFGIDIATSGVQRIYGPIDGSGTPAVGGTAAYGGGAEQPVYAPTVRESFEPGSRRQPDTVPQDSYSGPPRSVAEAERGRDSGAQPDTAQAAQGDAEYSDRLPGIPDTRHDPSVNRLADGTAGLLQSVSNKGIRMVVSFFESITD